MNNIANNIITPKHQWVNFPWVLSTMVEPPYIASATPILITTEPIMAFVLGLRFFAYQETNILAGDEADLKI